MDSRKPPFQLVGLDHVVIRVKDLGIMRRFYCDVLGCTLERERSTLGLVQLRAGRCLIDLIPVDGPLGRIGGAAPGAEGHNVDHFCLEIDRYDESRLREHLLSFGVTPGDSDTRYGARGAGPSLYLKDPEGNGLELKGPPSGPQEAAS